MTLSSIFGRQESAITIASCPITWTEKSIFTAAIGFILAHQPPTFLFTFLGMILCEFGILMVLQMAIVLERFSDK